MCGIFGYRPRWLQRFAKAYYFLICYVLFGIFQGALKAYLNGTITTVERKFALTGKMFGVILIADNISSLFTSLLVGYYATKISRPKIIAFGIWMSVLGCFVSVLPYIIYGPGFVSASQGVPLPDHKTGSFLTRSRIEKEFCAKGSDDDFVRDDTPAPTGIMAVSILFLANFLNGLGGTSFYISGATYTDDNVKKKNSPIYFSLVFSLRLLGPMLGYVSASVCLSIYESPFEDPGITNRHPSWIGAWWLGFVVWGSAMALMSLPMSLFPKNIRRPAFSANKPVGPGGKKSEKSAPTSLVEKLKDDAREMRLAMGRLCKNPVLMWKIATLVFIFNGVGGYVSMFPKYVENQYRVSASKSNLFTGPTKITAMMVGLFLGGVIIRIWKPRARTIGILSAFSDFVDIMFLSAGMYLGCSNWQLAGTEVNASGRMSIANSCNEGCDCTTRSFQPVCDVAQRATYFSPCAAGCFDRGNGSMYCTCIAGNSSSPTGFGPANVEDGFCEFPCGNLYLLVILISVGKLISQLPRVGGMLITLRCVDPADKGIAMGLMGLCFNLLAAVPYPLIYSAIFDATCLVWEERGGRRGNCWFYDVDKLRFAYHGVTIVFLGLGLICQLVMSYYAKRVTDMYGDAEGHAEDAVESTREDGALEMKRKGDAEHS
uniref:Solute carrier organic anion transporter family member n=2 Tax=Ixodes ricinus TaxID=34613 RepID=V5GF11_IXORI